MAMYLEACKEWNKILKAPMPFGANVWLKRHHAKDRDCSRDFDIDSISTTLYCAFTDTTKMVADALVYHPSVAHYLRFVATTGEFVLLSDMAGAEHLKSDVTRFYELSSTFLDFMPGICSEQTAPPETSYLSKPSRSNLVLRENVSESARMSSTSRPRQLLLIARTWTPC